MHKSAVENAHKLVVSGIYLYEVQIIEIAISGVDGPTGRHPGRDTREHGTFRRV